MYTTHQQAMIALLAAHAQFHFVQNTGPKTVYQCDGCGCFHLTSKGTAHEQLTEFIKSGEAKRKQEAHAWEEQWKTKAKR